MRTTTAIICIICFLSVADGPLRRYLAVVHAQSASPPGFLSIDCGASTSVGRYYDASSIEWTPDEELWPELGDKSWSSVATVAGPTGDWGADAAKYNTLRYFPARGALNQSKFCYPLPVTGGKYYLIRATFWMGSNALYVTRTSGFVSFDVIVDTYFVVSVGTSLPQTSPWIEEVYVRAMDGATSVAFCLSAANDGSDAPFINSLELRALPSTVTPAGTINRTNTALRATVRADVAAAPDAPSILRYPNDTLDRSWFTSTAAAGSRIETSEAVAVSGLLDNPPMVALQTAAVQNTYGSYGYYNVSLATGTAFHYYIAMWFAEVDPRVNASGQRVFDVVVNNFTARSGLDVFGKVGALTGYELYTSPDPFGPYSGNIILSFNATATSLFPPIVSAIEILQVLADPIATPTAASDVDAVHDVAALFFNSSNFLGDPCLPLDYRSSWINCTGDGIVPPRVTSISLSGYNAAPGKAIPESVNDLGSLTQLSLAGNALEGTLPDLPNLVNLRVLDLSDNKLQGPIPDSLGSLPKLTYIDLRNNNFSGVIPVSLQQKKGLTFRYEGNDFLCLTSNATCASSTSSLNNTTSSATTKNHTTLIIGVIAGVVAFFILSFVIILFVYIHKRRRSNSIQQTINSNSANKYQVDPHVLSQTQVIEVANVAHAFKFQEIIDATKNFSIVLGKGGFGLVYKGTLQNGLEVAIKVLSDASQQGEQEFLNEVALLSRARHKNLLGLVGYCIEKKLVLVYEYMPNGSLFDALFGNRRFNGSNPLSWIERLQILLDAAQGLAYLHHGCNSSIIHRDVKSSNILLTKNLEGKICDFGISRLKVSDGDTQTTRLLGSLGYLDPEYASTLTLSEKVDVYGFGVVIFETLCAQPPLVKVEPHKEIHIVDWVKPFYDRCAIEEVIDYNLGMYNIASIWKVAEVAMGCVQFNGVERPTMNDVYNELFEAFRIESSSYEISPKNTAEYFPSADVQAR